MRDHVTLPRMPLARHTQLVARSLDEAEQIYEALHEPIHVETLERRGTLSWRSNFRSLGPILVCANWHASAVHAWAEATNAFSINIPVGDGAGEARIDGEVVPIVAHRTAFSGSPGNAVDVRLAAGFRSIQLMFPKATLEDAAFALSHGERQPPLQLRPRIALESGPGAALARFVRYVVDELDSDDSLLDAPLVAARMADALMFQMLRQPNNLALSASVRAAEPTSVRRAAEYLDANAAEPIRLSDVAAVAGVSLRALQAGFRRYRGCSPMEFLRERRLLLAREQLIRATNTTIARVAGNCGFEHLGRFSAYYRARFGESPQATLRRRRASHTGSGG